jgi:DNA mismatch repair protein MutS
MCGVPVHAADDYLQKLIALGFRVAVCEQTEDPAEAKKRGSKSVVRRDVTRLVTPGTLTEERLLDLAQQLPDGAGAGRRALGDAQPTGLPGSTFPPAPSRSASSRGRGCCRSRPHRAARARSSPTPCSTTRSCAPAGGPARRVAAPVPRSLFDSATAEDRMAHSMASATLDGLRQFPGRNWRPQPAHRLCRKDPDSERPPLDRPEREGDGARMFIDPATRANLELMRTLSGERRAACSRRSTAPCPAAADASFSPNRG